MKTPNYKVKKDGTVTISNTELKRYIGEKIIDQYDIDINPNRDGVSIHNIKAMAYVKVSFDHRFKVKDTKDTVDIRNDKCMVSLFKKVHIMHVTIF